MHGKTLQSIRRKIEGFHEMYIFGDADTSTRLQQLKSQIQVLTGEQLADQPGVAAKPSAACAVLKTELLDPASLSALTGRLKRRVVVD